MLMEHNKEAYEQFKAMLLEHNECCLVGGTGIGKSSITTKFLKEYAQNALVICPRVDMCNMWEKMPQKYGIPIKIKSVTYHYFYKNYRDFYGYDAYIFDEAHHCGADIWGNSISNFRKSLTNEFVIGITADPNRYTDGPYIVNVVYTIFNGNVVYAMDRNTAIKKGILPMATYICALYDSKSWFNKYSNHRMTDELKGRLELCEANCESIEDIVIRHSSVYTNIKGIVFVDSIDSIQLGVELINKIFPNYPIYSVHSKIQKSRNINSLEEFSSIDSGFIVAVDMLNEGNHIDGVNMIIMLRKTISPQLYNQQLGRVFDVNSKNNVTIFDFVRNDISIKTKLSKMANRDISIDRGEMFKSEVQKIFSDQVIIFDYVSDIFDIFSDIDEFNSRLWSQTEDKILIDNYSKINTSELLKLLPNRTAVACQQRANLLGLYKESTDWTAEEDKILIDNYPSMKEKAFELIADRSLSACRTRVYNLKLTSKNNPWTDEEIKIMKDFYASKGLKYVMNLIPNRSKSNITSKAKQMGIKSSNREKLNWSAEEDKLILDHFSEGLDVLCKLIPHRAKNSISKRAKVLGMNTKTRSPKWSKEEDKILMDNYPIIGLKVIDLLPGRTESGISTRVYDLGIKRRISKK